MIYVYISSDMEGGGELSPTIIKCPKKTSNYQNISG